jgi:hypothetical protein
VLPYVESGYRHDGNEEQGRKAARFTARLKPGRYDVLLSWTAHANRASNVPVTIETASGKQVRSMNQRKPPAIDGLLGKVGQFDFGETGTVTISNKGADGYVVIDAVVFVALKR